MYYNIQLVFVLVHENNTSDTANAPEDPTMQGAQKSRSPLAVGRKNYRAIGSSSTDDLTLIQTYAGA